MSQISFLVLLMMMAMMLVMMLMIMMVMLIMIMIKVMNVEEIILHLMQINISLLQHMISISCSPPELLPAPQILTPSPPRTALWGRGGSLPRPLPYIFCQAPPRPAPPREKKSFPVHPWSWCLHFGGVCHKLIFLPILGHMIGTMMDGLHIVLTLFFKACFTSNL